MAAPGFKNEFKKGMKESHSKSSLPFSYNTFSSSGPFHGFHLGAFGLEPPQPGLLSDQMVTRLALPILQALANIAL